MKRIAVLCSGSGSNLQSLMDAQDAGTLFGSIELVLANRRSAYALERAKQKGIEALFVSKKRAGSAEAFDAEICSILKERNIQVVVTAGYLAILGEKVLSAFQGSILNIHPALLPSFGGMGMYGHHVHEAVLESGARVSGATVHYVTGQVDGGPIILQRAVDVLQDDTPDTLAARVLSVEHQILPAAVALHCQDRLHIQGNRVMIA